MKFEWNEEKSNLCFIERGFDFAYAAKAFFDAKPLIEPDVRYEYGEERFRLYGKVAERLFIVVFTQRNSVIRIISARKANLREVKKYEDFCNEA